MYVLLAAARRVAHWVAGRVRRRLSGNDGGFVLLESLIAISLISVIMAAIGVEYVAGIASVSRQRATQTAAQVADSTLEQIRAMKPSDLLTGRGSASVQAQINDVTTPNAASAISPWLANTTPALAPGADLGLSAPIPTCDPDVVAQQDPAQWGHPPNPLSCTQKPGTVPYTVAQFLGTCWLLVSSGNCNTTNQSGLNPIKYLRAVVSVGWTSGSCSAGCYYVTSTLINADPDPTFKANQPPTPTPAITPPGDQNNDVGDAVNLQLALVTGTGVPGFTWTITSGKLPTGLSLNASTGLISGVVSGATGVQPLVAQVTDGYSRSGTAAFNWTVGVRPTITTPANQTSYVGTAVSLGVDSTCGNNPCSYTLNNAPAGLSMSGATVTGTPSAAATVTSTVTIRDASGASVTSGSFTWTVRSSSTVNSPGDQSTTAGVAVNLSLTARCNYAPCTYSLNGQPANLTISNSGVITGTPNTVGTSNTVTATITDAGGNATTTPPFAWTIYARPTIITPGSRTDTVNTAVSQPISSTCSYSPCSYALAGAPAGLSIDPLTGQITGTPSATGTSPTVKVTVTDAGGASVSTSAFTWQIVAAPTIATPAMQTNPVGSSPAFTATRSCLNTPCTYTLNNGPTGLAMNANGTVTGSITGNSAVYSGVTITVRDSAGVTATSGSFTWAVTTTLPAAFNNVGVTKSTNRSSGNFDGSGTSWSYESVVSSGNNGPAAGARFSSAGSTYIWPATAGSGNPDNVLAAGQVLAYGGSGSSTLGFLVSATSGSATGSGTITYSDGTTLAYTLTAPDWRTAQTTYAVRSSSTNTSSSTTAQNVYAVTQQVAVNPSKAIAYITLPAPTGQLHVFAISQPPAAAAFNNAGIVRNSNPTSGNFDGSGNTISYDGIVANGGPAAGAAITVQGVTYAWPTTAGTGAPDNISANGQTIPYTATGGTTLGFLLSVAFGPSSGTGTINYTDGTSQAFTLSGADWVAPPSALANASVAFTGATRNSQSGPYSPAQPVNVDYVNVAVSSSKTISSIVLPNNTRLHIFSIGYNG